MDRREYNYKIVDNVPITADVYYDTKDSTTSRKRPIALHFHGGSFVIGSKELLSKAQVEKLLELGFVVVSANYRLCPTITLYDGPITDCFDAYKWAQTELPAVLKKDADVDVDGARIVVFGHSCGGTLALLTGSFPNPPLAILDFYGMKYLQDPFYNTSLAVLSNIPPPDQSFIDQVYKDIPPPTSGPSPMGPNGRPDLSKPRVAWMFNALAKGIHMRTVVGDGDFTRVDPAHFFSKELFPPTYFIHGTADTLVDPKFSQRANAELKKNGVDTVLVLVEGAGHGFDATAQPGDRTFDIVSKAFEFLKTHAKV